MTSQALMAKEAIWGVSHAGRALGAIAGAGPIIGDKGMRAGSEVVKGFVGAGGAALAGGIAVGAALGARKLMSAALKRHDFRQMLEVNPQLADLQAENPTFFNHAYTSLRSMNPTYGRDPVVSGTLMRQMMLTPENAGGVLQATMGSPNPPQSITGLNIGGGSFGRL